MRRFKMMLGLLAVALAAVALAVPGVASAGSPDRLLSTELSGANVSPGPGDPDAAGSAFLSLNARQRQVCFNLVWSNVDAVIAGHIHAAPAGAFGPVVLDLLTSSSGGPIGCVQGVDRDLIRALSRDPSAYYLDLHSSSYPAGAVRGQLHKQQQIVGV